MSIFQNASACGRLPGERWRRVVILVVSHENAKSRLADKYRLMHPAELPLAELLKDCQVERTRRRGPGGQHRNKVETAVVIRHNSTGVQAEASERRSQEANRQIAIFRLRVRLALEYRTQASDAPTPRWQQRVESQRITVSKSHDDFPALLAECLDAFAAEACDAAATARRLGVTISQLVKFLKLEPAALAIVNKARQERGEGSLK